MRWRTGRRSENVEDRRGEGGFPAGPIGIGGGLGLILLALAAAYFGVDPTIVLDQAGGLAQGPPSVGAQRQPSPEDEEMKQFMSVVLADTEDTWGSIFGESGYRYATPKLVLYSGAVGSACGFGQAAMGPFYCPADQRVYIDLGFYDDLRERYGAPGDFAQAYVLAHEVGHHVQNLLGLSEKVQAARERLSEAEANNLSVRLELQADCLAGLWAHHANRSRQILEKGDVEEALNAASVIGDDRMQRRARGYITPDSFTHGSSAQRMRWFQRGLESGKFSSCDTFAATEL